ncbi:hypothetical protein [Ligilactobacillus salitolerans]|nr:hypothetical protein [Ligilactobacillus salitolerans]
MKKLGETQMKAKQLRTLAELVTVVVLVFFAWIALRAPRQTTEHYQLDRGRIVYDGTVFKNKFSGQGKLRLKNGDLYQGRFKQGRFDGAGTFKSHQGWQFAGHFKNGQVTGHGKLTTKKQQVYRGEFVNGIFKQAKKSQD